MESEPGRLLSLAAQIKRHVSIPVATAGKLVHLEVAERALTAGEVDFITIGRGLHADPELLTKARSGRFDEVRRCIACAECVAFLGHDQPAYCAVNPATIREQALRPRRAATSKRVLVVGGGPAGLEAARAAALRGHRVSLFERGDTLGGQVRFGALSPGRQDFGEPVRFLERELSRLGVRVQRSIEVDADIVERVSPDVAIIATGATGVTPPVPGRELSHVLDSSAYLAYEEAAARNSELVAHAAFVGAESVAVVGGNWVGCHVASLLLERGLQVSIVETRDTLAYDMGDQPGAVLRERVFTHPGIAGVYLCSTIENITPREVSIWPAPSGGAEPLGADVVVLVQRRQPNQELAAAIAARFGARVDVHQIGDCVTPRKLQDAMLEGAALAAAL
jgi:2,4-dienoyl-CoA reductase (NADPH2)